MVMGFALCASVAFAQTARISVKDDVKQNEKVTLPTTKAPVDYKASIFSKANGHDTITVFKIDVAADYTVGTLNASARINDTAVGFANRHTVSGDANKWMRFSSITDFNSTAQTRVPGLCNFLTWNDASGNPVTHLEYITEDIDPSVSPNEPADDGFMLLSYSESTERSGVFNTYFTVPSVSRPSNAQMIEVSLTQCYRKYYDRCYIDYKVNGEWWAREINVDGIDMGVNTWASNKVRFVLPHRLNTEASIEIRIRAYSNHRGSAFGYFWAVDNVAVMALTLSEYWALNSDTKIDGFYGMIPQGMEIPLTWGVNAQNLSTSNINNAKAIVNAGSERTSLSQILQGPSTTVYSGNMDTAYAVIIDERGFYNTEAEPTSGYQSWFNHSPYFESTTGLGPYEGRGLPVTTAGKNFYSINVSGGNLSKDYDTILYYVSPNLSFPADPESRRENGYRWARDNGIIPAGASFETAFTDPDDDDQMYVTNDGSNPENGAHVSMAGYSVHMRFVTGDDIPEGWVFRGLELVTATDRRSSDMEGAAIIPVTYKEHYESDDEGNSSLYFQSLPCGIDGMYFNVEENDINDQLYTEGMYLTPDQGYKAVNIQFVEQPALEPNSSYRFGYRLYDDAQFALAGTRGSFVMHYNDSNFNVSFGYNGSRTEFAQAAAASRDYRYVPTPQTYLEVMVNDPVGGNITAWNIDNLPFIRPIVGPARPVEYAYIGAVCDDNTDSNGVMVSRGSDEFCGNQIQVTAGSQQRINFEPMGDHSVIDRVLLDGVELPAYDEEAGIDGYQTVYDPVRVNPDDEESQILLSRDYWVYYMSPELLTANSEHVFTVFSHWEEWDNPEPQGIDPVAPEAVLTLAPNPATSTVKVNMKGVNGMVNCSILDMSGRVIYNANINAESEHMINVSNIPAGAYFVRVTNDTFSKIEKLIIK